MKRKVIRQGHNTLTITLPRKWAAKNNVNPGGELSIEERDDKLVISTAGLEIKRETTLHSEHLERFSLAKVLSACYELGLDKVTIRLGKDTIRDWFAGEADFLKTMNIFVDRLIGFEVTSETKQRIEIENLSKTLLKLDTVVSRLFSILVENLQHFVEVLQKHDLTLLSDGELRHDSLTKFVSLGLRIIYDDRNLSESSRLNHFVILSLFDKAADHMRYAYRHLESPKNPELLRIAEQCLNYLEAYRSFYYNCDTTKINELDDLRGKIKTMHRKMTTAKDAEVSGYLNALIETLNGAVKPRVMIEMDKKAT